MEDELLSCDTSQECNQVGIKDILGWHQKGLMKIVPFAYSVAN